MTSQTQNLYQTAIISLLKMKTRDTLRNTVQGREEHQSHHNRNQNQNKYDCFFVLLRVYNFCLMHNNNQITIHGRRVLASVVNKKPENEIVLKHLV